MRIKFLLQNKIKTICLIVFIVSRRKTVSLFYVNESKYYYAILILANVARRSILFEKRKFF
jgi:hypothetical protein